MTTTIRISDPLDLVKVVPYQLGFHPTRSVVLLGLRGRRLGLVQRGDLPATRQAGAVARLMVEHLTRDGCTAAVLLTYETQPGEGEAVAGAVAARLSRAGIALAARLCVRDGRVHHLGAGADEPPEGRPLPPDDAVPALAEYVALGRCPVADRAALAAAVAPGDDPEGRRLTAAVGRVLAQRVAARTGADPALDPALERARRRRARSRALTDWGRFLAVDDASWFAPTTPAPTALARMVLALEDLPVRDGLAAWLSPGTLPPEDFPPDLLALLVRRLPAGPWPAPAGRPRAVQSAPVDREARLTERLCWLARHTPDSHAPAVLSVLASFAWYAGHGALARVSLERALTLHPGYRLALLLDRVVELGIRPEPSADRHSA